MATFEELYGAWSAADEQARRAEAEMVAVLADSPERAETLRDRAAALRHSANTLLDEAMACMRQDALPRRWRWRFAFAT